jgi:hypothetical protein
MGRFDLIEVTEWTGLTVFINKFELNYVFVFFTFQSGFSSIYELSPFAEGTLYSNSI